MAFDHASFWDDASAESNRAKHLFPHTEDMLTALFEEVGELANALLENKRGNTPHRDVYNEAVQVAAMAKRLACEGDANFPYHPETGYRNSQCPSGDDNWRPEGRFTVIGTVVHEEEIRASGAREAAHQFKSRQGVAPSEVMLADGTSIDVIGYDEGDGTVILEGDCYSYDPEDAHAILLEKREGF